MSHSLQFARFLAVGALNTVFGYAVFATLVLVGTPPDPALVATYVVGVVFNYFTTGRFVFRHAGGAFARFVLAYIVIYLFNLGLYRLLAASFVNPLLVQALCIPIVAIFSFALFKLHVFRVRELSPKQREDSACPGK